MISSNRIVSEKFAGGCISPFFILLIIHCVSHVEGNIKEYAPSTATLPSFSYDTQFYPSRFCNIYFMGMYTFAGLSLGLDWSSKIGVGKGSVGA